MKRANFFGCDLTRATLFYLGFVAALTAAQASAFGSTVRVTEEPMVIPTYLAGEPDPDPMFALGRNSQGAQGRVYPYPLYDTLTNVRSNKAYRIVYLENEYVRIGILPEIGGRLFEAVDKSNGYNFIYRQHVIKPALIGLIGAWISGGIEWNIPHHHRATTFLPVQYRVTENPDGSKTVWVGELEIRHRMRWAVGYTLYPGRSYLECSVRILNRTPFVNSMLCFANVAVHVNQNYQVIYPPGTRFVTFHGKREFTTWPVATTRYAGADFTRGVDVSWYSNHIAANSMFAWNYEDDFFAGYDHGREAGIMSFADHHIIPGKKFWTWGNGPRGRMWDKILTDTDGPYIELMVGAYSDNQPDYSWLQPYETKSFQMYWYPFRDIGGVKKANLEAAVNLELLSNQVAKLGFCVTRPYADAEVSLACGQKVLLREKVAIAPGKPFVRKILLPRGSDEFALRASLSAGGRELVAYAPKPLPPVTMPSPVEPPASPADIKTVEELYLAGLRIEQFHSPNLAPEPYWDEALRRDPGDTRVNTAMAIRELKQARFEDAEKHLRTAIARLTANYTAPKDSEALYYLGLTLQARAWGSSQDPDHHVGIASNSQVEQSLLDQAADTFYKATWSQAWRGPAYYALAEIASRRGDYSAALNCAQRSLEANSLNLRALALEAALLRHSGRPKEALAVIQAAQRITDPLDVRLMVEQWLAGGRNHGRLTATLQQFPDTGLETAAEYYSAGLWSDGIALLEAMTRAAKPNQPVTPLAYYYLGEFYERRGATSQAAALRAQAATLPPAYVFPFQWELLPVLQRAFQQNPKDPRAPYYLGNLLYDWQPGQARFAWEQAAALDPDFSIVHRNLAVAYAHQKPAPDKARAIAELERAVSCPVKYATHFTELDELYAATDVAPEKRLQLLEQNQSIVEKRDDTLSREIGLKVFAGKYDEAVRLMTGRKFSVWEGGSLDVAEHWVNAHLCRGRQRLEARHFADALDDFQSAQSIPDNLPAEQEIHREAELAFWSGEAYASTGNQALAAVSWRKAEAFAGLQGNVKSLARLDQQTLQLCYAALASTRLGHTNDARNLCQELLDATAKTLGREDAHTATTAAPSRRRSSTSRSALAHQVAGLCHLAQGENAEARTQFRLALLVTPDYLPAKMELARLGQ